MYNYTAGWTLGWTVIGECIYKTTFWTPINQKHLYAINYIQVVKYITFEGGTGGIGIDMRMQVYFEIHLEIAVEWFQCNQK